MANQGAKKRREENLKHMKNLALVVLCSNAIYILGRIVIFNSSVTWKHYIGMIATSGVYHVTYNWIKDLSLPTYDDKGELTDGGFDLKSPGLCSYLHDVLYVTAFVQFGSIFSDKFWYAFFVIPAFAFYKLWTLILYPYFFLSQKEEPENEVTRKKREKAERKANKPKFAKARR
ncbi:hypothetical protein MPTK1_7g12130 [Marchantia polymorpha subsp. ruderalis]|uniref:Transmembrane protein 208 n=2 Tax=Marchantia polymorpha TaxID=3197 RepID=A0A176VPC9_MARPO|nr:hypothetical protein AXG93_2035s1530 [Marchantia polymorpha subsp. ruderalis]PTQ49356.1 hypothetical protein MARPO_0003s0226 [Marchantia polymorpha]BBN17117.1 hypothetical protein Mp_7g12130 [Marchantia polymorpha subsp. ruderalis]|eukprot:PTQ49356.1 hypothetical protein MARPO_0003s0226 [Marchantia polymorpha]